MLSMVQAIRHFENNIIIWVKMCESEVKAAVPKIINGTAHVKKSVQPLGYGWHLT